MTRTPNGNLRLVSPSGGEAPGRASELDWTILMAHAQRGDATAYRRLLEDLTPWLRIYVRRWFRDDRDVEDCVQDILMTIHAIRRTYDPARPFGPWLIGIARRRVADRLRKTLRIRARETGLAKDDDHPADPGAEDHALDHGRLMDAIAALPASQRTAVRMLKLEEKSLKEVSCETGLSIASLKVATHRALKALSAMLSDRSGPK